VAEGTLVDEDLLGDWALPDPGSDKEERGQLLVVAGTRHTPGAALLAAEAAFRAGAGKLQVATARSCAPALATRVPELMVLGLEEDEDGNIGADGTDELRDLASNARAVLLGPGFTDTDPSSTLVAAIVPHATTVVVLDALATSYVTGDPERVAQLDADVVLTVNPTELACCLELDPEEVDVDLAGHAATLARRTQAVVLCGGETKYVAHGDDLWRVEAGNPGLGTAGSGDVQSGIVAGLVGRGASTVQAAVWGAFLHGSAGDRLARRVGPVGYLARELAAEVPGLLGELGGS
jgi:ADP-dependent NAD(P)H-hydrate dehydratase